MKFVTSYNEGKTVFLFFFLMLVSCFFFVYVGVFIESYVNLNVDFQTLDVSRTASYEITLVSLSPRLSVCPSVTKFSQDQIISSF